MTVTGKSLGQIAENFSNMPFLRKNFDYIFQATFSVKIPFPKPHHSATTVLLMCVCVCIFGSFVFLLKMCRCFLCSQDFFYSVCNTVIHSAAHTFNWKTRFISIQGSMQKLSELTVLIIVFINRFPSALQNNLRSYVSFIMCCFWFFTSKVLCLLLHQYYSF